ncbi:hypothetical protein C1646_775137 [Rhizophagus diaphanus]|nr:hypothetical protein C1646_775137 [Rhizophagus diaphanus] [Rhizophagus sp. MUCL 43196]
MSLVISCAKRSLSNHVKFLLYLRYSRKLPALEFKHFGSSVNYLIYELTAKNWDNQTAMLEMLEKEN